MRARLVPLLLGMAPLLAACARRPAAERDAGAATPAPSASAAARPALDPLAGSPAVVEAPFRFAPTEARRVHVTRFTEVAALAPQGELLSAHFGKAPPARATVESVDLAGGRTALLVFAEAAEANPLALLVSREGKLIWSKDRPLGGVLPPVTHVTIVPGAQSGVALALYDAPTRAVALRMWDGDGMVLVDFQLFEIEGCDALSALYWPERGWVAFAVWSGGSRAQLIRDDGMMMWGREAPPFGIAQPVGPASLVLDTPESIMAVQRGVASGAPKGAPPHLYVWRFDTKARPLWDRPADLGPAPPGKERVEVTRAVERRVRVAGAAGQLEVTSDGAVYRR